MPLKAHFLEIENSYHQRSIKEKAAQTNPIFNPNFILNPHSATHLRSIYLEKGNLACTFNPVSNFNYKTSPKIKQNLPSHLELNQRPRKLVSRARKSGE